MPSKCQKNLKNSGSDPRPSHMFSQIKPASSSNKHEQYISFSVKCVTLVLWTLAQSRDAQSRNPFPYCTCVILGRNKHTSKTRATPRIETGPKHALLCTSRPLRTYMIYKSLCAHSHTQYHESSQQTANLVLTMDVLC